MKKRPDHIEPGKWGTNIVFFKKIEKKKIDAGGKEKVDAFPVMRQIPLFNLEQVDCENLNHLRPSQTISTGTPGFTQAEEAIAATGATINFGGNRAVYRRPVGDFPNHASGDFIQVPERTNFSSEQEFYSTCFHELAHWAECRLGWIGSYALGELIAEIAACFLCNRINIPNSKDISNHTAYLGHWLAELKNDRKFIFTAATQATKAAEFIMGFSQHKESISELEEIET